MAFESVELTGIDAMNTIELLHMQISFYVFKLDI
jgi:hypothetical protein